MFKILTHFHCTNCDTMGELDVDMVECPNCRGGFNKMTEDAYNAMIERVSAGKPARERTWVCVTSTHEAEDHIGIGVEVGGYGYARIILRDADTAPELLIPVEMTKDTLADLTDFALGLRAKYF